MKNWLFILFILLLSFSLRAAVTNYVSVVGNVMQGKDVEFFPVGPLPCITSTNGGVSPLFFGYGDGCIYGVTFASTDCGWFGPGWSFVKYVYSPNQTPGVLCKNCGIPSSCFLLWVEANIGVYSDTNGTPAVNGTNVAQWMDQSGNGNNLTAPNYEPNKPGYTNNAINGLPAIIFPGYGSRILTNLSINTAQPFAIFMVAKVALPVDSGGIYYCQSTNSYISLNIFNGNLLMSSQTNGVNGSLQPTNGFTSTNFNIFTCVYNGGSSSLRLNGIQVDPPSPADQLPIPNAWLINFILAPSIPCDFYVSELIVSTDMSSVTNVETYLKNKYGLYQVLPINYQY
jgi:hypothetical protein